MSKHLCQAEGFCLFVYEKGLRAGNKPKKYTAKNLVNIQHTGRRRLICSSVKNQFTLMYA